MPSGINWNDPGVTTHNGQPIPIDSEAEYQAGWAVVQQFAAHFGVAADEANYRSRVLQGQTLPEILINTFDEALRRVLS